VVESQEMMRSHAASGSRHWLCERLASTTWWYVCEVTVQQAGNTAGKHVAPNEMEIMGVTQNMQR